MDDSVIALLNDVVSSKAGNDMFLDAEGEPTDIFLQALNRSFLAQTMEEATAYQEMQIPYPVKMARLVFKCDLAK